MMTYKSFITAAIVTATGLAFAMPVLAQPAVPAAPLARPVLFDFAKLDANADGKVTMDEIAAARDAAVKVLDANGDGKIDAAELTAYRMADAEARAKAQIAALDTDGDGALSAAELAARQIVQMPATMPQAMFDRVDTDKDGAISQAEFDAAKALVQSRGFNMRGDNFRGDALRGKNPRGRNDRNQHDNHRGNQGNSGGWMPFWHR
ncbi:EF-hand domain-containing protein [Phaeovulum sp.]|uniref:EF-hand domain-containing protein n=1 Tax=Phaeovulum sp. TaxID=2934796 RepID=UPI00272F4107|nr:EF-hand domain-containing protein [Phaeovulum sp.]MDP1667425.1 EF-hand domain-containing protein [Phaeovulum sp.]MDZ4119942.1 EF-hand domain-containing protein [Phaeovulum sp.]